MELISQSIEFGTKYILGKFSQHIIDRWSKRRAENFFNKFIEILATENDNNCFSMELQKMLDSIINDELKSQVLFESYRKVCLSASCNLGPRLIAVITARLIIESRVATPEEERICMAAEVLSDSELNQFAKYIQTNKFHNNEIELHRESCDSNLISDISIGSINLGGLIGNWSLKLSNVGLLVQDILITQEPYSADLEYVDEDGVTTRYIWKLRFENEAFELSHLISQLSIKTEVDNEKFKLNKT